MERAPFVNGKFYPGNPSDLKAVIDKFIVKSSLKISAKGVVLPHAGYSYSGRVMVNTINRILPKRRLLILGPNHTGRGEKFSLWPNGYWRILDKKIEIDQELAAAILNNGEDIVDDISAHTAEHSIEVELPILDYFFGNFKFVPIACQTGSIFDYRRAAGQILAALKSLKDTGQETLLVASSDFTHYEPEPVARKKDRRAIEAIINLDEEELLRRIHEENITLCGEAPLTILISCLKKLGSRKSQVSLYQTSANATGDKSAVVGYAGIIIH